MEGVALGLATVDFCLKYGSKLCDVCQAYKRASPELCERILSIEGVWLKTRDQVETIRVTWDRLSPELQIHQNHVLSLLQDKLQLAIAVVDGLEKTPRDEPSLKTLMGMGGDIRRFDYATRVKNKLDGIIRDLENWHRRFDPSWYLLARLATPAIDQCAMMQSTNQRKEISLVQKLRHAHKMNQEAAGAGSVFLPDQSSIEARARIQYAFADHGLVAQQTIIIDTFWIPEGNDIQAATKDVRDLARILTHVDPPLFGLLACQGVTKEYDLRTGTLRGFNFLFNYPSGFQNPQSLRGLLLESAYGICLDERFRVAKSLARSVLFLHSSRIVHKNISPETIILLENSVNGRNTPFLVGFEKFRRDDGRTYMVGDTHWEKNLYRHPKRQGEQPEDIYKMQHDIYSLGVCLLEIGLGASFVHFDDASTSHKNPRGAVPSPVLAIKSHLANKDIRFRASQIKDILVGVAICRLPEKMGQVYSDVVLSCLTCLDPGNTGFGDERHFLDEDGILVGIRYIEKVLHELEEIRF